MPNAASPMTFFDMWQDVSQQSNTFWWQAATALQPPDIAQQWQQSFALWADFWIKTCMSAPSPDMFASVQKRWTEQLETLARELAAVMGTEAFATMQSKYLEQQIAWQDKLAQAARPHIDKTLHALNLPSSEQIDRLFERIIGLEARFDEVEADLRQVLRCIQEQSPVPTTDTYTPIT